MSGRRSQQKGKREERACIEELQSMGIKAIPIASSGSGKWIKGDISLANGMTLEVKSVSSGYITIYKQLGSHDFLVIRANRKDRLYIIPAKTLCRIVKEGI